MTNIGLHFKIFCGPDKPGRVVFEVSQPRVALLAKKAANFLGRVAVVNVKPAPIGDKPANGAYSPLGRKERFVSWLAQTVFILNPTPLKILNSRRFPGPSNSAESWCSSFLKNLVSVLMVIRSYPRAVFLWISIPLGFKPLKNVFPVYLIRQFSLFFGPRHGYKITV